MKKNYLFLVALVVTTIAFGQTLAGDIIITEIMQNPSVVSDANGEYFEVYNTTNTDIDLNGWIISDLGTNSHPIISTVIVPANGYAVLAKKIDNLINGGFIANYQYSGFTLGQPVDEIILTTPGVGGIIVDQVNYDGGINFPNPTGASMELALTAYSSIANDIGLNWGIATSTFGMGDFGTPGTANNYTLSVEKNQIKGFSMFPNPVVEGEFVIASNSRENKTVEIYSMVGQQVFSKSVQANETINVTNLTTGFYFLKVEEEGKIATRKLIIK